MYLQNVLHIIDDHTVIILKLKNYRAVDVSMYCLVETLLLIRQYSNVHNCHAPGGIRIRSRIIRNRKQHCLKATAMMAGSKLALRNLTET